MQAWAPPPSPIALFLLGLDEKGWVEAYRAASEAFRAGVLDVMFPARALPPRLTRPPTEAPA